jgi:hypothetical protein
LTGTSSYKCEKPVDGKTGFPEALESGDDSPEVSPIAGEKNVQPNIKPIIVINIIRVDAGFIFQPPGSILASLSVPVNWEICLAATR